MFDQTNGTQAAERAEKLFLSLMTLTFDLDLPTRLSEEPNVLHVNLAQIRSAVPEIFHTQTKNPQTDGAKNRTFRSSLRAVIKIRIKR